MVAGAEFCPPGARRPCSERMPTPHPARHRAHAFGPPQSWRPRRARDRGTSLTLSSAIPARISLSLTGPDCSRCRSALGRLSAGGSTWQMALGHGAPRPQARPMVRPPICHASTPPAGPHWPLSRTSTRPYLSPYFPPTYDPPRTRSCGSLGGWRRGRIRDPPSR